MKTPAFRKFELAHLPRRSERGVTMILVAVALVAIIAMAALSIDVSTLYLSREEAQRAADAAALAAARVISVSGMTGDPGNSASSWQAICGGASGLATQAATAVATQSAVSNTVGTISVTYSAAGISSTDCSTFPANGAFSVNPLVTVQITRSSLPTFFSRIWGNSGNSVSATATAEVFNPSDAIANGITSTITPVQPRCVKPWLVPNLDPLNPNGSCQGTCRPFVDPGDGHIINPGISTGGGNATGVIGERFLLVPDCFHHIPASCSLRSNPPIANYNSAGNPSVPPTPSNLEYLPGQTVNSSVAVPSGATAGDLYEQAIAGCDQTTVYYCGVSSSSPIGSGPNMVDLSESPGASGDTTNGVTALINETNLNSQPSGQDTFNPYATPTSYPFQILTGSSSPLVSAGLTSGTPITTSSSVVSVPIYDGAAINNTGTSAVTIVGFLQVFINGVDQYGNVDVTVLNVSGCSNGGGPPVGTAVAGTSPVPIRLITPP
jgi:Flp pilus assembly protein TadG